MLHCHASPCGACGTMAPWRYTLLCSYYWHPAAKVLSRIVQIHHIHPTNSLKTLSRTRSTLAANLIRKRVRSWVISTSAQLAFVDSCGPETGIMCLGQALAVIASATRSKNEVAMRTRPPETKVSALTRSPTRNKFRSAVVQRIPTSMDRSSHRNSPVEIRIRNPFKYCLHRDPLVGLMMIFHHPPFETCSAQT
jgi:hypothetical protein